MVSAPLVLHSGTVRTMDPDNPVVEAIGLNHGVVVAVGTSREVLATMPASARRIDLDGAVVTPGLIDSHVHPLWGARLTAGIDLGEISSLPELQEVLRTEACKLPEGTWLEGWNLDYKVFDSAPPSRKHLDEAVGGVPTLLMFFDLHTAVASSAALSAAGITGPREFTDASEIVVDPSGSPTGELREPSAYELVGAVVPPSRPGVDDERLAASLARMNQVGVTGGVVMDGTIELLDALDRLSDTGGLSMRIDVFLWHRPSDGDEAIATNIAAAQRRGPRWRVAGIKLFSDGVVDTGTAWLHDRDCCGGGEHGFWADQQRFLDVVRAYDAAGLQLAVHAVGDRAVSAVLDAYATLSPPTAERPRRIEHLEVLSAAELDRLAASGVVASMQPLHMQWRAADLTDSWARRLGPDRAASGWLARSVLDAGTPVALGSDWPVAQYDPRIGMAWARGRSAPTDSTAPVFEPHECLDGEETLAAYTHSAALALGNGSRGWLKVGCPADLTVFAADPTEASPRALTELAILATIVDGELVHDGLAASEASTTAPRTTA